MGSCILHQLAKPSQDCIREVSIPYPTDLMRRMEEDSRVEEAVATANGI
jgi:hypothetical protein